MHFPILEPVRPSTLFSHGNPRRASSIEECEENDRRDNRSTDAARNAYGFDEWVHERIPLDYGAGK